MAHPGQPSGNIAYDPLPLTNQDNSNALYNAPPSPDPRLSQFPMPEESSAIPPGAGQPKFMAAPLYDAPNPGFRDSFTSTSQRSLPGANTSEYGSVYALNDGRGAPYRDDPSGNGYQDSVPMSPVGHSRALTEKNEVYAPPKAKSRRKLIILGAILGLILIAAAIIVPVYFTVIKKKDADESGSSDSSGAGKGGKGSDAAPRPTAVEPQNVVSGGDGSEITMEDGTTFIYRNPFGGSWYYDPNDPYSGSGQAQSWTPRLNETFRYGVDKIRGVNVGGWLNPEPFIAPALYEKYLTNAQPAVDEWTLSQAMAADTAGGGLNQLEDHYKTFITEKDFADIAAAGLNYIRLPIGFWAVEKRPNEPYLEGVSWQYVVKSIKWARKYGLRINLDLHTAPGSQNGWNHSGRMGTIGFLNGPMGYVNAQRTLNIIRVIAEFIAQPQYKDVVTMFGILNEPQGTPMGQTALAGFYLEAYNIVRNAGGGPGVNNGPWVSFHDGFLPRGQWTDVFPNADRISIDTHPYLCFGQQSDAPMSSYARTPCETWGAAVNATMRDFGLFNAGEFSNAVTDCGLFLNEVNGGTRYEGDYIRGNFPRVGSCTPWTDWRNYSPAMKNDIKNFALASMDALQHYFFWTWRIGNSSRTGVVETPAWSYSLGLQEGWMPEDPREADGYCGNTSPWTGTLRSGTGVIPASASALYPWPPAQISNAGPIAAIPQLTATGSIITLSAPAPTPVGSEVMTRTADPGSGWNNPEDNTPLLVEMAGCTYPDPWIDPTSPLPPACAAAGAVARRSPEPVPLPMVTPPPA